MLASSVERYDLWVNQLQVDSYKESAQDGPTGIEAAAEELAPPSSAGPFRTPSKR